jgi:(S)-ureidoglycine-glyoxylate aminotransferase
MGYGCRRQNVLICLGALEASLRRQVFNTPAGYGFDAAHADFDVFAHEAACWVQKKTPA